jgi:hypothetical protein
MVGCTRANQHVVHLQSIRLEAHDHSPDFILKWLAFEKLESPEGLNHASLKHGLWERRIPSKSVTSVRHFSSNVFGESVNTPWQVKFIPERKRCERFR